jgi:multiple sugar transport system permease protein
VSAETRARSAALEARRKTGLGRLRTATWAGRRIDWSGYAFVAPFFLPFILFNLGAIFFGVYISFTEWGIMGEPRWVGLANYARALQDPWVPKVWRNTLQYGLTVIPAVTLVALTCALYVNQRWPGYVLARAAFYLPHVTSITVMALVWVWILETNFGILNQYLGVLGVPKIPWLTNPNWVILSVAGATLWWSVGFHMVILLAGLQDIPSELREAAQIDGANGWQQLLFVTVPLLRPALSLVLTLEVIASLRVFGQIYLMTNGGPAGASASVVSYIFEAGFIRYELGYGAAISLMLFATILIVTVAHMRLFREMAY